MWIRNKITNTLQEIHNADVIKLCQKEPEKYDVSQEYPGDDENVRAAADKAAQEAADKAAKEADEKAAAEAEEKAEKEAEEQAADETAQEADGQQEEKQEGDTTDPNYADMKLNDLRKVAKEKGIQGYNNMDKATLVAVIQAH